MVHCSWIYSYLCNQYLSPLKLWVRTPFMARCSQCNIMWEILSVSWTGRWFSLGTSVSSTDKTDRHRITEILLKVALNTINKTNQTHLFLKRLCKYKRFFFMNYKFQWIFLLMSSMILIIQEYKQLLDIGSHLYKTTVLVLMKEQRKKVEKSREKTRGIYLY